IELSKWLNDKKSGFERKSDILSEMILLFLAGENAALESFRNIFATPFFSKNSDIVPKLDNLEKELLKAPIVEMFDLPLIELLRLPAKMAPDSIYGQLKYIKDNWKEILPGEIVIDMIHALSVSEMEHQGFGGHGGPGASSVLEFNGSGVNDFYPEKEQFSYDKEWMPNVVLLAKMVYVWLGQLSHEYDMEISRLDQIPNAELDRIAGMGINGLWLIGVWERSEASQKIKQICGNPEAIPSAYSLFDYRIAKELGGEEALYNLKSRASERGIRLASDMVPNHTGIYSRWTIEHPDWFIQLNYPPYPTYSFNGPDLSSSGEISLHIEDSYWDKSDAAVVFKHYDHRDGRTRYIYHGNDGTSTPWNDTAQLNYLISEVREAVINTIIHVAKMFPIIRFDAAMTLAKKHYQRLWFPQPGHNGVPSRNEYGMTRDAFDAAMPEEFWREVVDRVAREVPDTLLLAEAFWLMEGYFVRTLGMHRVYNSAFMNMLKMEENVKYRQTIKNVLEFDPEILQRFVNFMNNPDEKTAIEQFGRESKYFGICVMLVTMPGLPMIGHGQIEGFHEKYGMEYKKAYWNELPDEHFVKEHERLIFPLIRRRWLFSGAKNFVFYNFRNGNSVNEDVFAYSNRDGDERGIIVYHNRFASVSGWIHDSTASAIKDGDGKSELRLTTLGEALSFKGDGRHYYVFRDYFSGLEYIRNGREFCNQGLFVELDAYRYYAFLDFREIWDDEYGTWGQLCHKLNGNPVQSIDEEVKQIQFGKEIDIFREILKDSISLMQDQSKTLSKKKLSEFSAELLLFFEKLTVSFSTKGIEQKESDKQVSVAVTKILEELSLIKKEQVKKQGFVRSEEGADILLFAWLCLHRVNSNPETAFDTVHKYGLMRPVQETLYSQSAATEAGALTDLDISSVLSLLSLLIKYQSLFISVPLERLDRVLKMFEDRNFVIFTGLHESRGTAWIIKEQWETVLDWLYIVNRINFSVEATHDMTLEDISGMVNSMKQFGEMAGYKVDIIREMIQIGWQKRDNDLNF
ncbi:MAG: alpha-amylase family glycosyl hydrolase, partial [Desulfuromonadales bacterium]|nr:alpha-amylase family glycosyl hydrolase [Desulfuromonadales bacterium]